MTLTPNSRSTLVEALQSPSGYKLDAAIATTYSLDLVALLLADLSFGDMDGMEEASIGRMDPIRRLEAARRYGESTTVFTQAGAIHVPINFYPPFAFIEDSVVEVAPPSHSRLFHPKVWVLRFRQELRSGADYLHRVLILSRNLTMDNSWDTILMLDEGVKGEIEAAPAADFIRSLPKLSLRPISSEHSRRIADVARTLHPVRLSAPPPYTGGYLRGIGLDKKTFWPFPTSARRVLAISPFLTDPAVQKLERLPKESTKNARILVSRPESFDSLSPKSIGRFATKVLIDDVPTDGGTLEDEEALSDVAELTLKDHNGLHAKTYIVDLDSRRDRPDMSRTVTGSANLTASRWGNSVEFVAVLDGRTAETGVHATYFGSRYRGGDGLEPKEGAEGLSRLLIDHQVGGWEASIEDAKLTRLLEKYHRELAEALLKLRVTTEGTGAVALASDDPQRLRIDWSFEESLPQAPPRSRTTMWLVSAKPSTLTEGVPARGSWKVARESVTPFVAVETRVYAGTGETRREDTRRCVLKAELTGDIGWRKNEQIFDVLRSREDILRYLMLLLGEPIEDQVDPLARTEEAGGPTGRQSLGWAPVIFERLVRAAGRDGDALGRIAELLKDLEDHPNRDAIDLGDLHALWEAVWVVHKEVVASGDN